MIRKAVLFRFLAVVIGAGLTFAAVEVVGAIGLHSLKKLPELPQDLRAQVRQTDLGVATVPDPYVMYRLAPSITTDAVLTNEFGLRNGPVASIPEPDTFRVLLLGGSVAWGFTARTNAETLAPLLADELTRNAAGCAALEGRRVEVLNAGTPSYVSWQEALLYTTRLHRMKPHLIVSLSGVNDVDSAIRNGIAGAPARYNRTRPYVSRRPAPLQEIGSWIRYRVSRLKIRRYLEELRPAALDRFDPPEPREVAGAYREALEHLASFARGQGAVVVAVLQPMSILSGTKVLDPYEQESVDHYEGRMPGRNRYYVRCFEAFREMYRQLPEACPGVGLVDATAVFSKEAGITYTDHCHLTPHGRSLLAGFVADAIVRHLRAPSVRPGGGS